MPLIRPASRADVGPTAAALLRAADGDASKIRTRTDGPVTYFDVDDDVAQAYATPAEIKPPPRKKATTKVAPPED